MTDPTLTPQPVPTAAPHPRIATRQPWLAVVLASLAVWFLAVTGAALGLSLGALVPCDDGLGCLGWLFFGPAVGAALLLLCTFPLGQWLGLRWWFTPVTVALMLAAIATAFLPGLPGPWAALVGIVAPTAAALVALPRALRTPWVPLLAVVVLVGAWAVSVVVAQGVRGAEAREGAGRIAASGIEIRLPVERTEFRYHPRGASGQSATSGGYAVVEAHAPGRSALMIKAATKAPYDVCKAQPRDRVLPDGVILSPSGRAEACFLDGETSYFVYEEGTPRSWSDDELVAVVRALRPVDVAWILAHSG